VQIDNLAITTQSRNSWKSFDLGCRMALKWWKPLFAFWFIITAPLFIILNFITVDYAMFIIWIFKPWFERGLLHIYSRQVFGEQITAIDTLKVFPRLLKPMWLSSVTWRRLAPSRAFDLAVLQLEGLTGDKRNNRLQILHRTSDDNTAWWLIICAHWELFVVCGIGMFLFMLMPEGVDFDILAIVNEQSVAIIFVYNCLLFVAWLIVAPFHVGGGFAAYLNRRIILEGWDIELNFRQISKQRKQPVNAVLAVVLLTLLLGVSVQNPAIAQSSKSTDIVTAETTDSELSTTEDDILDPDRPEAHLEVKKELEELMSQPPFRQENIKKEWRWTGWEPEESEEIKTESDYGWLIAIVAWIAKFAEFILWICFIGVLMTLVWISRHQLARILRFKRVDPLPEISLPSFSRDYQSDSLPIDVPAELQRLLESEAYRQMLSLLLITSLTNVTKTSRLPLTASMTEEECKKLIELHLEGEERSFLTELINVWVRLAWAHQWPKMQLMQSLFTRWDQLYHISPEQPNV
jgi:hypothetical protein